MEYRSVSTKNVLLAFEYCLEKNDHASALKMQDIFESSHIFDIINPIRYKIQHHMPLTKEDKFVLNSKINLLKSQFDEYNDAIRNIDDSTEKKILDEIKGGFKSKNKKSKKSKKKKPLKKRKTRKH